MKQIKTHKVMIKVTDNRIQLKDPTFRN